MTLTITIARPPGKLSPNARGHWSKLYRAKKAARDQAKLAALGEWSPLEPPRWKRATVRIRWIMPTLAHHPDADNAIASLKAALDGISDWGIVDNDRGLHPVWEGIEVSKLYTDSQGNAWPRGCVVLTFSEGRPV